jgi:hypothetical protein
VTAGFAAARGAESSIFPKSLDSLDFLFGFSRRCARGTRLRVEQAVLNRCV